MLAPAEQPVEQPAAAQAAEVEAEPAEDVLEVDAAEQVFGREAGNAGLAARVVFGALLGVVEHRVGGGDLLEFLL